MRITRRISIYVARSRRLLKQPQKFHNRSIIKRSLSTTAADGKKDFFGFDGQADLYRLFRPTYPERLLEVLNEKCVNKNLALDIACGSGQLTIALAQTREQAKQDVRNKSKYGLGFSNVIGIDQSESQLSKAIDYNNISYQYGDALNLDSSIVADNSVDLVTIAQGLHWFMNNTDDRSVVNSLYNEVTRVLKPDTGVFAVLGYSAPNFLAYDKFHESFKNYYLNILGSHNFDPNNALNDNRCYWEIDRRLLDSGFQEEKFAPQFDEASVERCVFTEPKLMNEVQLFGYLESMSGHQTYCEENGKFDENGNRKESFIDPLDSLRIVFREELERTKDNKMIVNFPFFLLTMKKA